MIVTTGLFSICPFPTCVHILPAAIRSMRVSVRLNRSLSVLMKSPAYGWMLFIMMTGGWSVSDHGLHKGSVYALYHQSCMDETINPFGKTCAKPVLFVIHI